MATQEKFDKTVQCLIDNGTAADEAKTVAQALFYIITDEETEEFM